MTRRLDNRQLAFARAIAEGKSGAAAQLAAGYRPNRKNKNMLLDNPLVDAEIERLRMLIDDEWARQQCELRLLNHPSVKAEIDRQVIALLAEWHARQERGEATK